MSWLAACGANKPATVRTDTVEVFVPTYKALDPRLTTAAAEPPAPPARCRDDKARRTVCNEDTVDYLEALRAWGRGLAGQIREIAGLQPKEPAP